MTEETPVQAPRMQILQQYIRDLSFENIGARRPPAPDARPDIKVNVGLDAAKITDDTFDVTLRLNVNADAGESKLFVMELEYVGRFLVHNVPTEQLHPYLLIECPRMIFPYARRIVSDMTRDGGFPPLNLENIDFLQLYRTELERRQAGAQSEIRPS